MNMSCFLKEVGLDHDDVSVQIGESPHALKPSMKSKSSAYHPESPTHYVEVEEMLELIFYDQIRRYEENRACSHRRYNCIERLKVADTVIEGKQHIKEYWPSIRTYTPRMKIGGLQKNFKAWDVYQLKKGGLEVAFTKEEVRDAINSCAPGRSPGIDGFTMAFHQKALDTIKHAILAAPNHFHHHGHIVNLIANEFMDWKIKYGGNGLLLKLDVEKASDKISWPYPMTIPRNYITTVKYSILINRGPVRLSLLEEGCGRGPSFSYRQWKVLVIYSRKLNNYNGLKDSQWVAAGGIPISISHLLFADDTLIFCGAEKSQVLYLNLALMFFEAMSGLHIHMLKSIIYLVNIIPNLVELADIMGYSTGKIRIF
ncbi:hypothetical protein H5410_041890 [Solanum commersonii]|uniref:Reverse transcriptase domain-containing protein n=1 Tax=Solanum commersonii TaxID=4109 RepID=A0A9J5XW13_SOLCO|nr:hypothetical protein H5410_041890 [Solanum commersonii]